VKNIIKVGVMGVLLAFATLHAGAATTGTTPYPVTTNYWVQNVNFTLTAYVQWGNEVLRGTLPTKQFIAFLSGVTNSSLITSQTVVPATNSISTNLTVEATDFWLLPTNDFPRSYTVTDNYVLSPDGSAFFTNNINFTNDVVVTRATGSNITYTFNNSVAVSSTQTAYLFPGLPSSSLTAVLTNDGPGTVFALSGSVTTNVVTTTTNYTYGTNPAFTNLPSAKLVYITPVVSFPYTYTNYTTNTTQKTNITVTTNVINTVTGTNLSSKYYVRYTSGKTNVDVDVSSFLSEYSGYTSVSQVTAYSPLAFVYAFSELDFNNQIGTKLSLVGFDSRVYAPLFYRNHEISSSVLKQRKIAASDYSGELTGQVQRYSFSYNSAVVTGSISLSGGKVE
jgi:hypothetical protein